MRKLINTAKLHQAVFFMLALIGCVPTQIKSENMTDDQILDLYNKEMNFDIKFPNELCIIRTKDLPEVITVGSFAHDLGCVDCRVIVGGRIGKLKEMTAPGLRSCGWKEGGTDGKIKLSQKADLLRLWTRHVVLINESIPTRSNRSFAKNNTPNFSEPQIDFESGQWTLQLWVQEPSGMLPGKSFYKAIINYDEKGNFLGMLKTKHFSDLILEMN